MMTLNIINCTPHAVKIVDGEGNVVKEFLPSGLTIRLSTSTEIVGNLLGVPLTRTVYGKAQLVTESGLQPLPEQNEGTYFIVSAMIKGALPEREDMLVPAEQVRDDQGRVIGCKSLGV